LSQELYLKFVTLKFSISSSIPSTISLEVFSVASVTKGASTSGSVIFLALLIASSKFSMAELTPKIPAMNVTNHLLILPQNDVSS